MLENKASKATKEVQLNTINNHGENKSKVTKTFVPMFTLGDIGPKVVVSVFVLPWWLIVVDWAYLFVSLFVSERFYHVQMFM